MTTGYYCAIFPFCGGGKKKKKDKKTETFYDWATTGIPVMTALQGPEKTSFKFFEIFLLSELV